MHVQQTEIDAVEAKLNAQNGFKAALAVAIWSVPVLVLWYWIYLFDDRFAPIMLALSGAVIGIVVRIYGRGYLFSFAVIAFLAHFAIVAAAFMFGLSLGEGQSVRAFILVGLYGIGAWSAVYLGRINIPFEQHRAFYVLTEQAPHNSSRRLRNRWFLVTPQALLGCCLTLSATLFVLTGFEIFRTQESVYENHLQQRQAFEDKAIEVTSVFLDSLSSDEAMRYAYAFYNGFLPSKTGKRFSRYPQSQYKAKRILSYLIEERDNSRAKFVFGRLNYHDTGTGLIEQAAEQGDIFAKIYVAMEIGCYGDVERAKQLLLMLGKVTTEKRALNEISSISNTSFERVCTDAHAPDFALMYIHE